LPADAHAVLIVLAAELAAMQTLIASIEKWIMAQHRKSDASQWLESIPGIGFVGATAIDATVTDPKAFRSGRDFAAWIGLVPRQDSTGASRSSGRSRNRRSLFAAHSSGGSPCGLALREAEP
jgi:transposase